MEPLDLVSDTDPIQRLLDYMSRDLCGGVEDFFDRLLVELSAILPIDIAVVGRLDTTTNADIDTLSVVIDGQPAGNLRYPLAGSPCETVLRSRAGTYRERAAECFPDFPLLGAFSVEAYAGAPLKSIDGLPIGLLVVMSRTPFADEDLIRRVIEIAAIRTSAVLQYILSDREIRETAARYHAIVEDQTELVSRYSVDGIRTFVNDAYCWFKNRQREELLGCSAYEGMSQQDLDEMTDLHHRLTPDNPVARIETHMTDQNGRSVWVQWSKRGLFDEHGRLLEVQAVGRDVTEQKQAEQQRNAALFEAQQANRVKSEFLANMSHELRTPLNSIIGFAESLSLEIFGPHTSPKYSEYSGDILSSATHLLSVINDILDLSRIEAGETRVEDDRIDLPELIGESVSMIRPLAAARQHSVRIDTPRDLPPLVADSRLVRQILLNILSNAIKYTGVGGSITVTAGLADGKLFFSVSDTGIGIAEEDLDHVLEPFGQARAAAEITHPGTGLGLAICKHLAELHGGRLKLDSKVGIGTTVTVFMPCSRTSSVAA